MRKISGPLNDQSANGLIGLNYDNYIQKFGLCYGINGGWI